MQWFGPAGGTEGSLPEEENSGGWDGVVGKYDPLGNLSRSDLVGSGEDDWLQAIEVSKDGRIAVGGYSRGNLADNGADDDFDAVLLW